MVVVIADQNPVTLGKQGKKRAHGSRITKKFADVEDCTVSSTQGTEGLENGHDTFLSRNGNTRSNPNYLEGDLSPTVSSPSYAMYDSGSYNQADRSREYSLVESKSLLETHNNGSSTKANGKPSIINRDINEKAVLNLQTKQVEYNSIVHKDKDSQFEKGCNPWWLKLPYVLAIFLRRGSDHNGPKGLYSLQMNSSSNDGNSVSCTVAFQDRGDATNFCYLLESFFEELGDVNADIVPLTIQELEGAVKAGELKVIVVRKGQLHLYAGQPLAEVEAALHSLSEES